jgi:hypothetical protein
VPVASLALGAGNGVRRFVPCRELPDGCGRQSKEDLIAPTHNRVKSSGGTSREANPFDSQARGLTRNVKAAPFFICSTVVVGDPGYCRGLVREAC